MVGEIERSLRRCRRSDDNTSTLKFLFLREILNGGGSGNTGRKKRVVEGRVVKEARSARGGGGGEAWDSSIRPSIRTYVRAESMFCKIQEVLGGREDGK